MTNRNKHLVGMHNSQRPALIYKGRMQVDAKPSYDLFVTRSMARSFAEAIESGCHE